MIKERRRHRRFDIEVPFHGQLLRRNKRTMVTNEIPVFSRDISLGGVKLNWPKSWKCPKCVNCLGWVFNSGCRFKKGKSERVNRLLDKGIVFKIIIKMEDSQSHEILSEIAWTAKPEEEKEHYEVGLNFIKVNKEAEEAITSLISRN